MKRIYQKTKDFYGRYERLLLPTFLILGFLFDYTVFTSVQAGLNLLFLLTYWIIAGLAIVVATLYDSGRIVFAGRYIRPAVILLAQFSFGSLLSGSFLFYWFSGAFSVSWPFIGIIAGLMIFYDILRNYFLRPVFQLSLYFFITIIFFALALPIIFNSISAWLFVGATTLSLVVFIAYALALLYINPLLQSQRTTLFIAIGIICLAVNIFYFANIIPPIPLSLREAGVYHSINVQNGQYIMAGEPKDFWGQLKTMVRGQTIHVSPGQKVYLYTAIFAPPQLKTIIVHHWQYYNAIEKKWVEKGDLPFSINGGRQEGYKGYSWQRNLEPGTWRVYVENSRGQVLAKVVFFVESVAIALPTENVIR